MTVKANVPPDYEALGRRRVDAASLLAKAVDHVERAAVCLSGAIDETRAAGLHTDGPRLSMEAVLAQLRLHRETLVDEQSAMVDAYADALRRAEGQR